MQEKHVGSLCELPPLMGAAWGERCSGLWAWSRVAGKVLWLSSTVGLGTPRGGDDPRSVLVPHRPRGRGGFTCVEHCIVIDVGKHLHFDFLIEKEQQTRSVAKPSRLRN